MGRITRGVEDDYEEILDSESHLHQLVINQTFFLLCFFPRIMCRNSEIWIMFNVVSMSAVLPVFELLKTVKSLIPHEKGEKGALEEESSMLKTNTTKLRIIGKLNSCSTTVKRCKRRSLLKLGSPSIFEDGDFPDWLLTEILSRLPIKLVFRCKCISKHWLSIISGPSFSHFYLSRAYPWSVPRCPWAFVPKTLHFEGSKRLCYPRYKRLDDLYSGNLTFPDSYVLPLPNSQEAKGGKYFMLSVSNGFVLYGWHRYNVSVGDIVDEFYVCNPITRQWFALPAPTCSFRQVSVGFIAQVEAGILTSYKVVLLNCPDGGRTFLELAVFSSETGEWAGYSGKPKFAVLVFRLKRVVVLNNNLHWEDRRLGIIAYNPYISPDKFRIIDFPDEYCKSETHSLRSMCDVHQGHLKFCEVTDRNEAEFKIWVLEDYITDHWCLQHTIKRRDIIVDDKVFFKRLDILPAAFHPFDEDVVYFALEDCDLVSYNIRTRMMEVFSVPKKHEERILRTRIDSWPPCFLLELPPWPVSISPSLARA